MSCTGPTKEQQTAGYFKHSYVGVTADAEGVAPRVVIAEMRGDLDPGYGWTSLAVLEAGLCLALQVSLCATIASAVGVAL